MSAKEYTLKPYAVVQATALSTSITSKVTDIMYKDNINYQYIWTGTLAGNFSVQTSSDYRPNPNGDGSLPPLVAGSWDDVPITGASAVGSPNSGTIELNNLGANFIRTIFTRTSGTGNLTIMISGKAE